MKVLSLTDGDPRPEDDLVGRAARGDFAAFERLYEQHAPRVLAFASRMCADRAAAEDLVQEIFLRAWRGLKRFRGQSRFSTWLYRIAANVVFDRTRRPAPEEIALDPATRSSTGPMPHARIDLERAIAELPPRARLMLLLVVEGYRYDEVAAMTGVTVGTVKQQVHRARELLLERIP